MPPFERREGGNPEHAGEVRPAASLWGDFKRAFVLVLGALTALAVAYLVYLARWVLLLFFVAVILAQTVRPAADRLRRWGLSIQAATAWVYLVVVAGAGLLAWRLELALSSDLSGEMVWLAQFQDQLRVAAAGSTPLLRGFFRGLSGFIAHFGATASGSAPRSGSGFTEVRTVLSAAVGVLGVLLFSLYWLAERAAVKAVVLSPLPERQRERAAHAWDAVEEQFGSWARGELLLMLSTGVPFAVMLTIAGVKNPLLLAVFAGVVGVIPVVGSIVGPLPAVLMALSQNVAAGIAVLVVGIVIQVLEGAVIGPRVMSRMTGVSPFTVLAGVVIGGAIGGIVGALIAVPLAAAAHVALRQLGILELPRTRLVPAVLRPIRDSDGTD